MGERDIRESKLPSLVPRHRQRRIGITLDKSGWTDVAALLEGLARHGMPLSMERLVAIIA